MITEDCPMTVTFLRLRLWQLHFRSRSDKTLVWNVSRTPMLSLSTRMISMKSLRALRSTIQKREEKSRSCLMIWLLLWLVVTDRSSHLEVFLGKGVLKICSKFTGEHPCRSAISIKLQSNFIEITLRHGCFPVNLLHIFRTPLLTNTSGRLFLHWTIY